MPQARTARESCSEKDDLLRQVLDALGEMQTLVKSGHIKSTSPEEVHALLDKRLQVYRKYEAHVREHGC